MFCTSESCYQCIKVVNYGKCENTLKSIGTTKEPGTKTLGAEPDSPEAKLKISYIIKYELCINIEDRELNVGSVWNV